MLVIMMMTMLMMIIMMKISMMVCGGGSVNDSDGDGYDKDIDNDGVMTMMLMTIMMRKIMMMLILLFQGHAAPILYAAWAEAGLFPVSDLAKLRSIDSDLEGHPTPVSTLLSLNFLSKDQLTKKKARIRSSHVW